MPIQFQCEKCGHALSVSASWLESGSALSVPNCLCRRCVIRALLRMALAPARPSRCFSQQPVKGRSIRSPLPRGQVSWWTSLRRKGSCQNGGSQNGRQPRVVRRRWMQPAWDLAGPNGLCQEDGAHMSQLWCRCAPGHSSLHELWLTLKQKIVGYDAKNRAT